MPPAPPANPQPTPADNCQPAPSSEPPLTRPTLVPILPEVAHVERGFIEPPAQLTAPEPPETNYLWAKTSDLIALAAKPKPPEPTPATAPPEPDEEDEPLPPLRQLKARSTEDREWAYSLARQMKQDEPRETIQKTLGTALGTNSTYSQFCNWQRRQRLWDHLAAAELQDVPPEIEFQKFGSSRAWLRDSLIKRGYAQADLEQDVKLALKVAKVDLKDSANSRQWVLAKFTGRSKLSKALAHLREFCCKYPELRAEWHTFHEKFMAFTEPPPKQPADPAPKTTNP